MSYNHRYQKEKDKKVYYFNSITGQLKKTKNDESFNEIDELIHLEDKQIKNTLLYNECPDLSPKEIELFSLWNEFMDNEKDKGIWNTEDFLKNFIVKNMDYVKEKELINELMLFMNYLVNTDEISFNFFFEWSIKIN